MIKIKSICGAVLVFTGLIFTLVNYIGQEFLMEGIVSTVLKNASQESVNKIAFTLEHSEYKTNIHKPVFYTLFSGSVQVDLVPVENLPELIDEDIDYDQDGTPDFNVRWKTDAGEHAQLTALQPQVLGLRAEVQLEEQFVVRVNLLDLSLDN